MLECWSTGLRIPLFRYFITPSRILPMNINQRTKTPNRTIHQRAFTLVELLLVLVILGILAAIVIPKFSGRSEQAKEQAARTQISNLSTALNNFEVDNSVYPKSLTDLLVAPRDAQSWHGPYLQTDAIPKDPWGNEYIYKCPGTHNPTFFDLSSTGPGGGDTVIANWTVKR